jgi:hypothetical protein
VTETVGILDLRERPHHAAAVAVSAMLPLQPALGVGEGALETEVGEYRQVLYAPELAAVPSRA